MYELVRFKSIRHGLEVWGSGQIVYLDEDIVIGVRVLGCSVKYYIGETMMLTPEEVLGIVNKEDLTNGMGTDTSPGSPDNGGRDLVGSPSDW
jgi:hypothetical protein